MSNLKTRVVRAFDGNADLYIYENLPPGTPPPAIDGVQGSWALALTSSGMYTYGPKTDELTWPSTPINTGPPGPAGTFVDRGAWSMSVTYALGDVVTSFQRRWLRVVATGTTDTAWNPAQWIPLDSRPGRPKPLTGQFLQPEHASGLLAAQAVTSGRVCSVPIEIGPDGCTVNGLAMVTGTALVAGSATIAASLSLYADDGTTGLNPDWSQQLATGDPNLAATAGNRIVSVSVALAGPQIVHLVFFYTQSAAPTTAATVTGINAATNRLPSPNIQNSTKGMSATGVSALPTTKGALTLTPDIAATIPYMALRIG